MMNGFDSHQIRRLTNQKLFEQGDSFQGNMPLCLRFSLMEDCNLHCTMCQRAALPSPCREALGHAVLDFSLYETIAAEAFLYAQKVSFEIAGEPTLHPRFKDILALAQDAGVQVEVWSNGSTLSEPLVGQAIRDHCDLLVLSVDTLDQATLESIRVGLDSHALIHSIRDLKTAAAARPPERPLRLTINATLMKQTIAHLPALVREAKALGIDEIVAGHIGFFESTPADESLFLHKNLCNYYLEQANAVAKQVGMTVSLPPLFVEGKSSADLSLFRCAWVNHTAILLADGTVIPCCHAAARFRLPMGNVRQAPLADIWYGPKYMLLRQTLEHHAYMPCCHDCVQNNPFMDVRQSWSLESFWKEHPFPLEDPRW
ncbi:MAG: radical SAM protein, partial [bacterium]|nr:radical SAM protein [bacterium]